MHSAEKEERTKRYGPTSWASLALYGSNERERPTRPTKIANHGVCTARVGIPRQNAGPRQGTRLEVASSAMSRA
jgi:hypothetical protein